MKDRTSLLDKSGTIFQQQAKYSKLCKFFSLRLIQFGLLGQYHPDDILSEVYIRYQNAINSGKIIFNEEAWLRKTGLFYVMELNRERRKYCLIDAFSIESTIPTIDNSHLTLDDENDFHEVRYALQELSEKDRDILQMRFFDNLSWRDIANRLGKDESDVTTLRKQGQRALEALRKVYLQKVLE